MNWGRRRAADAGGRRPAWRRRLAATALAAAFLTSSAGYGLPVIADNPPAVLLPHASATPAPGEPGGNHSKPGDNKKKKKQDQQQQQRRSDNGSRSDRPGNSSNDQRQAQDDHSNNNPNFQDQTNGNNGWTQDGDGRSVDVRVARDGSQGNGSPSRGSSPSEGASGSADTRDQPDASPPGSTIPPKRQPLTPEQQRAYDNIKDLPSPATRARLPERTAQGDLDYNRDPFNTGTPTEQRPVADHLIPKRRLAEMPGFADLDRDTQRAIADSDDNIYAAAPFENSSRKERTFAEYFANGPNQSGAALDPAYRQMRISQENEAYRVLQQRIDDAWAAKFGQPRVSSGPVEVDLSQPPLEVNGQPSPPEMPAIQAPAELPVQQAPLEMPPISVAPQLPPAPPTVSYPLPPVRPTAPPLIGVPVAPNTIPAAPAVTLPPPPPVGIPARLPAWSTPPPGPVAIPTVADPLATLGAEQNALNIEANSILDRQEALQALPGFDTNAAAIAEYQGLQALAPQIAARQSGIGTVLANPPAALVPPKSLWQQTVDGAKAATDAVSRAVTSVWGALTSSAAVPGVTPVPVVVP